MTYRPQGWLVRRLWRLLVTTHPARHVLISVLVVGVFVGAGRIDPPDWLFAAALIVHLISLTVSLGAVVVIDWTGLAWMAGLRTLRETMRTAEAASPLVWLGLAGLLASGLLLEPDLGTPLPWVKMTAILLLANNGLVVDQLELQMRRLAPGASAGEIPPSLLWRIKGSVVASHVGWWTAVGVGIVTMLQRR